MQGEIYQLHDIYDNDIYPQTLSSAVLDPESGKTIKQVIDDLEAGVVRSATPDQIQSLFNE